MATTTKAAPKKTTVKAKPVTPKSTAKKAPVSTTKKATVSVKNTTPKKTTSSKATTTAKATEAEKVKRNELIESILKKNINKNAEVDSIPFTLQEFQTPKEFVVIIDTKGNIYQEPVPRYCSFDTFKKFLATFPDVPEDGTFNFKSQVFITQIGNFEVVTSAYDGSRKNNPFANKFPEIVNETKLVGGNLVFTGLGKPLSKTDVSKVTKMIEIRLNAEEVTEFND